MHFTGMAAYEVAGRIAWDSGLVLAALAAGAGLGAWRSPPPCGTARSVKVAGAG